ncbi:hypothetical protein DYB36_012321 [Aphanomyces astaci]|uniref:Uncharacterized protein n=1 Tax=Aphanomyces astaci TaxID=112090 RepID=A0A397A7B0_APHAT|nr:hypothetical protein DYB36_012321 [Aphanomyces astaci]
MSGVGKGTCTPTHYNAEICAQSKLQVLNVYANESPAVSNGYVGQDVCPTFGREFTFNSDLVKCYSVQNANLTMMADKGACPDRVMGCRNGCSKSNACTLAEAQGTTAIVLVLNSIFNVSCDTGKTCLIVAMMYSFFDPGYLEAAIANNNIPAYFCFSGYDGMEAVTDVMNKNGTVTFYHCESDFTFPNLLHQDPLLVDFLTKFQLDQVDINSLLNALVTIGTGPSPTPWLDPLPLCSFQAHMEHTVGGCDNSSPYSNVSFVWATPDPANASLPCQLRWRDGESAATNAHESVLRLARRQRPPVVALARYESAL